MTPPETVVRLIDYVPEFERMLDGVRTEAGHGVDTWAHAAEKELWEKVLEMIAVWSTDTGAAALAATALESREIAFSRWFG